MMNDYFFNLELQKWQEINKKKKEENKMANEKDTRIIDVTDLKAKVFDLYFENDGDVDMQVIINTILKPGTVIEDHLFYRYNEETNKYNPVSQEEATLILFSSLLK